MSDSPGRDGDPDTTDDAGWAGLDSGASITPDPFLAEVARIPSRPQVPGALPRPGDTIGRFVLRSELGRGGMGVVFAAEDVTLGREVALKVLPSNDEARRRRFLREARSAAVLSDPAIATVYDVGEADGRVFIAMELIRGETLRARLDARTARAAGDRALPPDEARRVARAVARALAVAHARGIIHRDLKPENVMVTEDGQVKLLDFGLAKIAAEATVPGAGSMTETAEGHILGTPGYMSPEQVKGRPVDARSDVFSFGVLLYELLTGKRPFTGATPVEVFIAIDRDEPPPPASLRPGTPPELARIVHRCLRKDPAARYPDAAAILQDLEAAPAPAPRRSRAWILGAALVALAAGRLVVAAAMRDAPPPDAPPAAAALRSPTPPEPPSPPTPPTPPAPPAPPALASLPPIFPAAPAAAAVPTAMTELPAPPSARPEAAAEYRTALALFRGGESWTASLLRALELDPSLAVAHVQSAAAAVLGAQSPERIREHYRRADGMRASLGERDRGLLDATEPLVRRQPADWAESIRRLRALTERFPGDAQLWFLLGAATANFADFEESIGYIERAIAIDPAFAHAHAAETVYLAYLGRFPEAQAAVDRCLAAVPGSMMCLLMQLRLRSWEGDCEGVERAARRMIAAGAEPAFAYPTLASALAARGQPLPTVREALRQGEEALAALPASMAGEMQRRMFLVSSIRADLLGGDFEAAERDARALGDAVAASSKAQHERGRAALLLAYALEEAGRGKGAGRVAVDFLDRRDAWEPDPGAEDIALAADATPALLLVALRAGTIDRGELAARRDPWLRGWTERITPVSRSFLWLHGHAGTVETAADARAALDALPRFDPLPPFRPETLIDAAVGRSFLLAGRAADAIAWLTRATRSCVAFDFPVEHTRAHLWLGQAREAQGDRAGACSAYSAVLSRWGEARPRSVTADAARDRARALGCAG